MTDALTWAGTYHGIGARLLREYAEQIGLDPAFTIHDREDSADLMNLVRHEKGFSKTESRFPTKGTCLSIYSRCVNAEMPIEQVIGTSYPWCAGWAAELKELFAAYVEAKQKQNVLDYDDLLLYWAQMVGDASLADDIGGRFDHVLVDEYQDTNRLQSSILLALKPGGRGLTVVGDDAQSIYSFRAATVRNILDFPDQIADIAYQNKAVIYDLLFKASAETTLTIAADPKHLGARIGFMSVLHTWGSALTHHPHVHMVVPGGGLSPDGSKWIACRPRYFLTVQALSALFRRLFLEMLVAAHHAGRLQFFGEHARLADKAAFAAYLAPLREINWVVYAKEPFAGPRQVLRYLSRYTHRIAISNRRLLSADENGVTFKYKDYRIEGPARDKAMTLATDEFIRRFLIHVLPKGFHRIRHYGLLANGTRAANIAHARQLLAQPARPKEPETPEAAIDEPRVLPRPCPCCGGRMIVIETFERGCEPKHRPTPAPAPIRIDTS